MHIQECFFYLRTSLSSPSIPPPSCGFTCRTFRSGNGTNKRIRFEKNVIFVLKKNVFSVVGNEGFSPTSARGQNVCQF